MVAVMSGRERWRKVPGWPYDASYFGGQIRSRPRSLPNGADHGGQVLTPTPDKDGYPQVTLYGPGHRRQTFAVHVLVAWTWLGPPEVLHGPGGKEDSGVPNLRWGSRRENERDKRRETFPDVSRGRSGGLKERKKGTEGRKERGVAHPLTTVAAIAGDLR